MELIKVENRSLLKKDLENKLGASVVDIHIDSINFLDGFANLMVKYNPNSVVRTNNYVIKEDFSENGIGEIRDPILMKGS